MTRGIAVGGSRTFKLFFGVVVCLGLLSALTGPAEAFVRSASVADARDAPRTISGVPTQPDIKNVSIQYDSSGTISVTATFYNAQPQIDSSSNFAFLGKFNIGSYEGTGFCDSSIAFGQQDIYGSGVSFQNSAFIPGYEGRLPFQRSVSDSGRSVTTTATSPAIANLDLTCFDYRLDGYTYASASNPSSEYSEGCNCWHNESSFDFLGTSESPNSGNVILAPTNYFDGFTPVPVVPGARVKVASKVRLGLESSCRSAFINGLRLSPEEVGGTPRWYTGKLAFTFKRNGRTLRRFISNPEFGNTWVNFPPGRFRYRVWYTGDKFRKKSNVLSGIIRSQKC